MYLTIYIFIFKICSIYGDFAEKEISYFGRVFHITFDTFLENKIQLTYGDSEKAWKTHEIVMKYGNFINVFW